MIYVMSDIHGNTARFESVMKQINLQPTDTLYVLGDVIDRFPDGIRIFRRLMAMPNVKMLLGNHELLMLNALDDFSGSEQAERYRNIWYYNGGRATHNYLKHIKKTVRREVFDYLRDLPTERDVEVSGVRYKLVHGAPFGYGYEEHKEKYISPLECAVWSRWTLNDTVPDGYTLIFGHTPTYKYQPNNPLEIWHGENCIGIDCGAGIERSPWISQKGRLACLRLDDMQVFYSEE